MGFVDLLHEDYVSDERSMLAVGPRLGSYSDNRSSKQISLWSLQEKHPSPLGILALFQHRYHARISNRQREGI